MIGTEDQDWDAQRPELGSRGGVGWTAVQHDQVGRARRYGFDVGREPSPDARDMGDGGGIVACVGVADQAVTGAEGEEELGGGGIERDDAVRGTVDPEGITRIVDDNGAARPVANR